MSEVVKHAKSENTQPVSLTESALQHIVAYLQKEHHQGIRLSVKKTGCSGLSYVIDYVENYHEEDVVSPLNHDYFICIDKRSYPFLKGLQMDYVKQGLNYKFVFNNPNQTGQCGCGESFTVV